MNTEPLTTKCYACFSEIVFEAGEKQKRCSYCGRMNDRPRIKPESKEQLENALLIHKTGEFDAAKNQYQLIMNDNPNDYLSKWGWLLCQYGVIYVEDEWENKKERRVTCRLYHPSHFRDEPMYQDVLAKASPEVLADFIKDAEYIDSIQGEIQRLQNAKEKPYDIFICYKETAPGGGKTEDHEIAYRIYNELEQLNQYRVFYAPESMKGKVGANYEAVIFWAIEKSRVMLVLGTKKEYFESTWVHSEWKRFLDRIHQYGDEKKLIPLFYRSSDLPYNFSNLEGYNLNEHYLEPLKSELRNYLRKESIWDAGYMYLEDRDFDLAENHFRDCLKEKPKEAMIWLGLAMAVEQVCNEADLSLSIHPLKENKNFRWALQYAEGSLRVRLEAYLKQNEQRIQAEGEAQKVKEAHILETEEKAKIEVEKKRIKEEEEKKTEEVIFEEYPTVGNDFEWEIMPDETSRIKKYVGLEYRGKEILIPSFLQGYPVTSIGDTAFYKCVYLTKITIPDSVTTIGSRAFYGCESLEEVAISDSITSIGDEAFYGCASLTEVTIPEGVTAIGDSTFWGCISLVEVTIPKSVTSIGNWAFWDCKSLMSATIPENVTSIASHAFSYCNNLSIYGITGSYVDIYAKEHNIPFSDPTEVDWEGIIKNLDARIKELEEAAEENTPFEEPKEEEKEEGQTEEGLFEYRIIDDDKVEITGYNGYLTEIVIPSQLDGHSVTSIGKNAFLQCKKLTSVTIPDNIISIGDHAFEKCSGLTSMIIPPNVTSIGWFAFGECSSLTSVTIPDSINSISAYAFCGCSNLTSVNIPNGVTSIGEFAFSKCRSLTSVTIPDAVIHIGHNPFSKCEKLINIYLSDHHICFCTFDGVLFDKDKKNLICYPAGKTQKQYSIPSSVTSIGNSAFAGCIYLTSVHIPDSITSIDWYAFENCCNLTSVTIPNNVASIGSMAFDGCINLTKLTLPNNITSIDWGVFCKCSGLTAVTIPKNVTSIDQFSFSECSSLVSVTIPKNVTSVADNAFSGCCKLTIYGSEGTEAQAYARKKGIPFIDLVEEKRTDEQRKKVEEQHMVQDKDEEIPFEYRIIEDGSAEIMGFKGDHSEITIPAQLDGHNVTCIRGTFLGAVKNTFEDSRLTSVHIPNSVTCIGKYAFSGYSNLTSVTIPNSVISIEDGSFSKSESLTIYGSEGSKAHAYANENSISFIDPIAEERRREERVTREQRKQKGLCVHCGGEFSLFKKCKNCGRKKDY